MNLTEILLLGILIMLVVSFHSSSSGSGRYAKLFDIVFHQGTHCLKCGVVSCCNKTLSGGRRLWRSTANIRERVRNNQEVNHAK